MFIAAVDVYYYAGKARAVCILFDIWSSVEINKTFIVETDELHPYEPGLFYKRELPCILKVLQHIDLSIVQVILVDGYVYLDDQDKPGLGAYLYEVLQQKVAVLGVAKTAFFSLRSQVKQVIRGESKRPLYITAVGLDLEQAANNIKHMAGVNRIPYLLKRLDLMTKQEQAGK